MAINLCIAGAFLKHHALGAKRFTAKSTKQWRVAELTQSRNVAVKFGELAVGNFVSLLCLGVFRLDSGYNVGEPSAYAVEGELDKAVLACIVGVDGVLVPEIFAVEHTLGFDCGKFLRHAGSPPLYAVGAAVMHLGRLPKVRTIDYVGHGLYIVFHNLPEYRKPNNIIV